MRGGAFFARKADLMGRVSVPTRISRFPLGRISRHDEVPDMPIFRQHRSLVSPKWLILYKQNHQGDQDGA